MPRHVPDYCTHGCPPPADHHCTAKLIGIAEAPGRREDELGEPLVGPTGAQLERWWEPLGIRRSDCYLTNVYPFRPPANKIAAIPRDQITFWTARLHERLAALSDPIVLVPMGNLALRALFDEGMNISDWRGSIMSYTDLNGRAIKVIPTIHPAATFRQAILTKFCLSDWKRISEDRHFKELRLPEISVLVEPSEDEITSFLCKLTEAVETDPWAAMAVDIENDKHTGELLCVGYSLHPNKAVVLPLSRRALFSGITRDRMFSYARALAEFPIPNVLQNGQHDQYVLRKNGIDLKHYRYDLMEMDHALDPNDGGDTQAGAEGAGDAETIRISMRSLAVLCSLHTRFPYYKKGGRRAVREFNWQGLYDYNGMDACSTRSIFPVLLKALLQRGLVSTEDSYSLSASSEALQQPSLSGPVVRSWEPSL